MDLKQAVDKNDQRLPDPLLFIRSFWTPAVNPQKYSWRILMVVRSAERIDRVFGEQWLKTEIYTGKVNPTDLNVPSTLRNINQNIFKNNSPITTLGKYHMQLIARAIHNRGLIPKVIYSSPALRSIETASAIAQYLKISVSIEPGLLESGMGNIEFGIDELSEIFPIDTSYVPLYSYKEVREKTLDAVKARQKKVMEQLASITRDGPLIIVAHGITLHSACELAHFQRTPLTASLDNVDQELSDSEKLNSETNVPADGLELGLRYPPGCLVSLVQHGKHPKGEFRLIPNLVPSLTSGSLLTTSPVLTP